MWHVHPVWHVLTAATRHTCIARPSQEFGGRILPVKRGQMSAKLLRQLQDEAVAPLWPDPEDTETEAASDAVPVCSTDVKYTTSVLQASGRFHLSKLIPVI